MGTGGSVAGLLSSHPLHAAASNSGTWWITGWIGAVFERHGSIGAGRRLALDLGPKVGKDRSCRTRRSSPAIGYRHFSVCRFDVSLSGVRRHDQSKGANSVSATAGCILFWIMVQGSVPTDAWVLRCIIKPQSQMSMEDAFCIMTPCVTRALYGRGDLFQ
jgi:hypothetical protein